jgi:hypothetical protein
MKNKIKYIAYLLFTAPILSCSSLIDEVKLDTSITTPSITENNLPLVVRGMYQRFSSNITYAQSAFGEEVASDNLASTYTLSSRSNLTNFDLCKVSLDDNLICARMFSYPYNGIGAANLIINFVNDKDLNTEIARQAKGEALMLRGYCYMLLAERFGKAVITLGLSGEAVIRTQNTEDEVWEQAEKDLLLSLDYLADYTTPNSGSKQAAQALLARLYLNRGVLTSNSQMVSEAGKYAALVTGYSGLLLNSVFTDNYISTSSGKEVIFRLVETVPSAVDSRQYKYMTPRSFNGTPTGSTYLESSMVALYDEPADKRAQILVNETHPSTGEEVTYCTKYPADKNPVWTVVRLAEMHLIIAEVKARQGTVDVTDYNKVRQIRNASLKQNDNFANAEAFLNEIENERRRELVAEGLRWMDMRRFDRIEQHLDNKGVDKRRVHFPVYTGEITNNPALTQTDYYGN